jgi:hypothetical protein
MNFNTFTPIHLTKKENEREKKDILFVVEKTKDFHGGISIWWEKLYHGGLEDSELIKEKNTAITRQITKNPKGDKTP